MAAPLWRTDAAITFQPRAEFWAILQCHVGLSPSEKREASLTLNRRALASELVLFVFMFFPVAPSPDVPNFNWAILVLVVVVVWAIIYYYVWGRKHYVGPVTIVRGHGL